MGDGKDGRAGVGLGEPAQGSHRVNVRRLMGLHSAGEDDFLQSEVAVADFVHH